MSDLFTNKLIGLLATLLNHNNMLNYKVIIPWNENCFG